MTFKVLDQAMVTCEMLHGEVGKAVISVFANRTVSDWKKSHKNVYFLNCSLCALHFVVSILIFLSHTESRLTYLSSCQVSWQSQLSKCDFYSVVDS